MNAPQFDDFGDSSQQQPTQVATQTAGGAPGDAAADAPHSNAYACLQPCAPHMRLPRVDLLAPKARYAVGRNPRADVHFGGMKISFNHAVLVWNGRVDAQATVSVQDHSTNGTWINGVKLEKGHTRVLRDGNELAFGAPGGGGGADDYRFIFRLFAGAPASGLNAHYDLAHELGHGSFATVMKALHRASGRWCAVKIIHGSKIRGGDGARLQAFMREISILEALDHENICAMHERFFDESRGDENIYLVLELVEGGDLLDHIIKNDGMPEDEARDITRQICKAMAYIHAKGITHRDLKPENILLSADKKTAKVADFGLAKVVDQLTMLRTMCGTPSYLAPEVVNPVDGEGYDHLVDSWSVGVIVFSMLTNATPFQENEELPMPQRIAERTILWSTLAEPAGDYPPPSPHAHDFIRRLLDPDPATRMSLAAALEHPWLAQPSHAASDSQDDDSQNAPPPPPPPPTHANAGGIRQDVSMLSAHPTPTPARPYARLARRADVNAAAAEAAAALLLANAGKSAQSSPDGDAAPGAKRAREDTGGGYGYGNGGGAAAGLRDAEMRDVRSPAKKGRMEVDEEDVEDALGADAGGARGGRRAQAQAQAEEPRRSGRAAKPAARR